MNDDIYDPRIAFEWVPMFLVCIMMSIKCLAYISPYVAVLFMEDSHAKIGLIASIAADETFNMLLVTLTGYWIGKKVGSITSK